MSQDARITVGSRRDLIVIGGGTAGMAAAIYGAMLGLRVVVFDQAGEDYDKPCGEGLMPEALGSLATLGVEVSSSRKLNGVAYFDSSGRNVEARFNGERFGCGVRRRALRQAMWQRARSLGVEIIDQTVTRVETFADQILVEGISGEWACLATGTHDGLSRSLGLADPRPKRARPHRTGLRRHAKIAPWSDVVEVYWADDAELYVTPVGEDVVNIAILSWKAVSFDDALRLFPAVCQRLEGVVWDDTVGGLAPLAHRGQKLRRERMLLAGDAAGFLDAMTGEGNALALGAGMDVARLISRKQVWMYPIRWRMIVWRYWLVTTLVLWVSRPGFSRRMGLAVVMRAPWILRRGLAFLTGS